MPRFLSSELGIGELLAGDVVRLLAVPEPDVGSALENGRSLTDLAAAGTKSEHPLAEVGLRPPIPRPSKIWAQGIAYRDHAAETGHDLPSLPRVFLVAPSALQAAGAPVRLPALAPNEVDYEGEVVVVIGRRAEHVDARRAWEFVAGITAGNDISARDVQKGRINGVEDALVASNTVGKSFDTFKPMGPVVASVDGLADRDDIGLRTWVDGELRQDARTRDLLFSVPELLAYLSSRTTLLPGDLVMTGTPGRLGPVTKSFLRDGARVRVEVEGVGVLENPIVASESPPSRRT